MSADMHYEEPWLFTSRYAEPAVAVFDGAKVRITVGHPRFRLGYTIDATIRELAPHGLVGKNVPTEWELPYRARLDHLGVDHILGLLEAIRSLSPSRKAVLLCFERIGEPCHRRTLAAWLEEHAGLVVPELTPMQPSLTGRRP